MAFMCPMWGWQLNNDSNMRKFAYICIEFHGTRGCSHLLLVCQFWEVDYLNKQSVVPLVPPSKSKKCCHCRDHLGEAFRQKVKRNMRLIIGHFQMPLTWLQLLQHNGKEREHGKTCLCLLGVFLPAPIGLICWNHYSRSGLCPKNVTNNSYCLKQTQIFSFCFSWDSPPPSDMKTQPTKENIWDNCKCGLIMATSKEWLWRNIQLNLKKRRDGHEC